MKIVNWKIDKNVKNEPHNTETEDKVIACMQLESKKGENYRGSIWREKTERYPVTNIRKPMIPMKYFEINSAYQNKISGNQRKILLERKHDYLKTNSKNNF